MRDSVSRLAVYVSMYTLTEEQERWIEKEIRRLYLFPSTVEEVIIFENEINITDMAIQPKMKTYAIPFTCYPNIIAKLKEFSHYYHPSGDYGIEYVSDNSEDFSWLIWMGVVKKVKDNTFELTDIGSELYKLLEAE